MKKIYLLFIFLILSSCMTTQIKSPNNYIYTQIHTTDYTIASWQKITNNTSTIRIYVEGDGKAYTQKGYPSNNPTPKNSFIRDMAFNDKNDNVIYLARPCQYIKDKNNNPIDWTTGRFCEKIINNMAQAIKQINKYNNEIVLIGYSGGALITGLIINKYRQELNIVKWITIAGLLNHTDWTKYFNYIPLKYSLDLNTIPNINQKHYIAKKDTVIPYHLTLKAINNKNYVIIENATHNDFKGMIKSSTF